MDGNYQWIGEDMSFKGKHHTEETKRLYSLSRMGDKNSFWGKHHSKETRDANSIKHKGNKYRLGKKHSDETKIKISLAHTGKYDGDRNPFWGKHHSEYTKSLISMANKGNKYHLGKHHTKETKLQMSLTRKGRVHSEETKRKLSLLRKGKKLSGQWKRNIKAGWTEEVRKRVSLSRKGRKFSKEHKEKIGIASSHRIIKNETRNKLRAYHLGTHLSEKAKMKISIANKGRKCSDVRKKKISEKALLRYKDIEYKNKHTKATLKGVMVRPTKPEIILRDLLDERYPNEWKYVGNGEVVINGKNPDFVNINGRKAVILLHGQYWHLTRYQKDNPSLTKEQIEREDKELYKNYGWESLIVWDKELQNKIELLNKIREFCNR